MEMPWKDLNHRIFWIVKAVRLGSWQVIRGSTLDIEAKINMFQWIRKLLGADWSLMAIQLILNNLERIEGDRLRMPSHPTSLVWLVRGSALVAIKTNTKILRTTLVKIRKIISIKVSVYPKASQVRWAIKTPVRTLVISLLFRNHVCQWISWSFKTVVSCREKDSRDGGRIGQ
jgi:hypothetical protein